MRALLREPTHVRPLDWVGWAGNYSGMAWERQLHKAGM
jgi:hypothetical protein